MLLVNPLQHRYAERVASGYRPKRPNTKGVPLAAWELVEACWDQDPVDRPHMSEVVATLEGLLAQELGGGGGGARVADCASAAPDAASGGGAAKPPAGAAAAPNAAAGVKAGQAGGGSEANATGGKEAPQPGCSCVIS